MYNTSNYDYDDLFVLVLDLTDEEDSIRTRIDKICDSMCDCLDCPLNFDLTSMRTGDLICACSNEAIRDYKQTVLDILEEAEKDATI